MNRVAIGGFGSSIGFWSSTETAEGWAWCRAFFEDSWVNAMKYNNYGVRAVRSFPASPAKAITAFSFQGLVPSRHRHRQ